MQIIWCILLITPLFRADLSNPTRPLWKLVKHSEVINNCVVYSTYQNVSTQDGEEEYRDPRYGRINRPRIVWKQELLYTTSICENVTSMTFDQLPAYSNNLTSILFKNSTIYLVPVRVLNVYQDLTELYINSSNVKTIHPGAFTSLINLNELHLEHNCITKITTGILNSLVNLNNLYLSYNNISEIGEHAFLGLSKLSVLDISFNSISYVLPDIFYDLSNLKEVNFSNNNFLNFFIEYGPAISNFDISYNQLTVFNFSVFWFNLTTVSLRGNNIEYVYSVENVSVNSLDLSNNKLSTIDYIENYLTYLNVSGNQLSSFTDETFFNSSRVLETLDFSSNIISNLSANVFAELRNLRNLLMQNNYIENIPLGCFRNLNNLTALNLSSNFLTDLDYGTFMGLSSLRYLDLSNNKLSILYDSSLHPLKNLRVLNIAHNFLNYLDSRDILDTSTNLRYISLHDNPWSCKALANTIVTLEKQRVTVEEGPDKQERSLHGINCERYSQNVLGMNASTDENSKRLNEMTDILRNIRTYFDKDFLKSEFYKYFENLKSHNNPNNITKKYIDSIKLTDAVFENTKLYKFFNSDIPKTNPLKQLLEKLTNVMQDINNIKQPVYSTFQNNLRENLSNSNILRDMATAFNRKLAETFQKVDIYIDKIFNDGRFADLFNRLEKFTVAEKKNSVPVNEGEILNAYFSAYTANKSIEDVASSIEMVKYLDKIEKRLETSSGRNESGGSTAFFSIIIVILLAVVCLISFGHFANHGSKFCRKSSRIAPIDDAVSLNNSRIEMM